MTMPRRRYHDRSPGRPWACRLSFHSWRLVKDTLIHRYYACCNCEERRIAGGSSRMAQPVDMVWLDTGVWLVRTPPRPNNIRVLRPDQDHVKES